MIKFNYKLIEGNYEDVDGFRPLHVIIIRHRVLVDQPRSDGRGYEVTDETVVEAFTRRSEAMAREDAFRRVGELSIAAMLVTP